MCNKAIIIIIKPFPPTTAEYIGLLFSALPFRSCASPLSSFFHSSLLLLPSSCRLYNKAIFYSVLLRTSRMKLDKLHVLKLNSSSCSHRAPVARARMSRRAREEHTRVTTRRYYYIFTLEPGSDISRRQKYML